MWWRQKRVTQSFRSYRSLDAGELLIVPITFFFIILIVSTISGDASSRDLIISGLVLDVIGAMGLALPDLIIRRHITTPDLLIESRRQMFQIGHLIRGETEEEKMDAMVSVIKKYWEGDLLRNPHQLAIRQVHPKDPDKAIIVVYEEDGQGPVEWAKQHYTPKEVMDLEKSEYRRLASNSDDFDFIGQQTPVYQWIGEEIKEVQQRLRWYRTEAAITLTYGFILMLISYFVTNSPT